jgi:hypothetical protein
MYTELGLFTTMNVYPQDWDEERDSAATAPLNKESLERLAAIPGVELAYPFVAIDISAQVLDTTINTKARALPLSAVKTRLFSSILAGASFSSDTAAEALVTPEFVDKLGLEHADSLIGKRLVLTAQAASIDSAMINVLSSPEGTIGERIEAIRFDSVFNPAYRERVLRRELDEGLRRFLDGLMNRQLLVSDTLTIRGVGQRLDSYRLRLAPVIIPEKTARHLCSGGLMLGSNPSDMFTALSSGKFFQADDVDDVRSYPQVTLELAPLASAARIKDSVEALGYRAFSFAEQFKQMQRFFLYFNLGLGFVGLIALITAALGIVNTMVMSILERRREIGAIKSLGADERHIKAMFLVESGVIGAVGAIVGIVAGWIGTRIASEIFQAFMRNEDMPPFDPFSLPLWLIFLAFAFGVTVSLFAGLYPAARAARVDPVQALRAE